MRFLFWWVTLGCYITDKETEHALSKRQFIRRTLAKEPGTRLNICRLLVKLPQLYNNFINSTRKSVCSYLAAELGWQAKGLPCLELSGAVMAIKFGKPMDQLIFQMHNFFSHVGTDIQWKGFKILEKWYGHVPIIHNKLCSYLESWDIHKSTVNIIKISNDLASKICISCIILETDGDWQSPEIEVVWSPYLRKLLEI